MIKVLQEEKQGDVFWDLPTWVYYTAGYDLGCIIYVANPTDAAKEYMLMTKTSRSGALINEGTIQVHGLAWFTVEPGDFIRLYGTMNFSETGVNLTVDLIEKVTEEVVDSVSTILVQPSPAMPPGWDGAGGLDWMSLLMMMMVIMMMSTMMKSVSETEEEKKARLEKQERKKLGY